MPEFLLLNSPPIRIVSTHRPDSCNLIRAREALK